ncbi:hypothetical protein Lal_00018019 [Lupinus albus]|uniref:E3 ubiquitin-protein ligase RMA n=1 Tax=Lupinus albus TaxID=3870 RepID=A0A6A5M6U1_LUPAL|nr:putative transcription factor C2H2 family [Lupinus albus]KAF1866635.1 hypothetical protein Lal_00018019 [Lupinus albus]
MEENSRESSNPGGENGWFVCNICLGSVHDPVVTLCGHLYCWPCIYRRLRNPTTCQICNAEISFTSLVPLYGRGISNSDSIATRRSHMGLEIPPRPMPNNFNYMPTFSTNEAASNQNEHFHEAAATFPFQYSNITTHMLWQILDTRRNEMEAHNSLNMAYIFLLCCVILCLLLF